MCVWVCACVSVSVFVAPLIDKASWFAYASVIKPFDRKTNKLSTGVKEITRDGFVRLKPSRQSSIMATIQWMKLVKYKK